MYEPTSMPCQRRGVDDESAAGVVSAGGGDVSTAGGASSAGVAAGTLPCEAGFSFGRFPLVDFSCPRDGALLWCLDLLAGAALGMAAEDVVVAVTSVSRGVRLNGSR